MKKYLILALMLFMFLCAYSKTITIQPAAGPITIDGADNETDWNLAEYQNMVENIGAASDINNVARFKMMYDKDFLYVFVEVKDSQLDTSQGALVWEKDCIETFICLDTTYSFFDDAQSHIMFINCKKTFGRSLTDYLGFNIVSVEKEIEGGRTQEWKFPWDSLAKIPFDFHNWNRHNFRFEIMNRDNDGSGVKSQLFWNSNEGDQIYRKKNWGYVYLEYPLSIPEKQEYSLINIKADNVEFSRRCNYVLFNTSGIVIRQGSYSKGFSTRDLKCGFYLIKANNETVKFVKF